MVKERLAGTGALSSVLACAVAAFVHITHIGFPTYLSCGVGCYADCAGSNSIVGG